MLVFDVQPAENQRTVTVSSTTTAVVVIPARYHSTRLPGKALAQIAGRPMIEHVYARAKEATSTIAVIVATDDMRIYDAVREFGGEARLTRAQHENGTERLAEVARSLSCDYIVNVQGDEPLIEPATIDVLLASVTKNPQIEMATIRCPITETKEIADPNVVKVVVDQEGVALYFSRCPIPSNTAGASHTPVTYKHVGIYAYQRTSLLRLASLPPTPLEQAEHLEQLRALEHGYRIQTFEIEKSTIGVDTPDDLERVRRIFSSGASP